MKGEVYEVDDKVLSNLDILEEHPDFYQRQMFKVLPLDDASDRVDAWIYVIKKFKNELLSKPLLENYSSTGNHGLRYVERYLRSGNYDHRKDILVNWDDLFLFQWRVYSGRAQ